MQALFRCAVVFVEFEDGLRVEGAPVREASPHILPRDDIAFKVQLFQQGEGFLFQGILAVESGVGKAYGHHGVDDQQFHRLAPDLARVMWTASSEVAVGLPILVRHEVGDV